MVSFDWTSRWGFLLIPAICIFGFITNFVNIIVLLNPNDYVKAIPDCCMSLIYLPGFEQLLLSQSDYLTLQAP